MYLFNFSEEEILTFFAVLVRFTTLSAILPILGDKMVPAPLKIMLGLVMTIALYPALVKTGAIQPGAALVWGATAGGIASTIALEVAFALVLGFTAKLCFDAILFGANMIGTFMGFASASTYDPHQESNTQVVAEVQMTIAMLLFLALDGHHLMLHAALSSYSTVGLGKIAFDAAFAQQWIDMSQQVILFGLQLSAPVAVCLFTVNVAFGVMAKSMPQSNILVLSMGATALVGLLIVFISVPQTATVATAVFERMGDWMTGMMGTIAVAGGR